jgi:hypothetical protein
MPRTPRQRLGLGLLAAGLLVIVAAVLWVLEAANGPGAAPRTFAERRSYDQVKVEVHRTFPFALLVGLAGLGLAMFGNRLAQRAASSDEGLAR